MEKSFLQQCAEGTARIEQLDDFVERWHESGEEETRELHDFLGLTEKEHETWIHPLTDERAGKPIGFSRGMGARNAETNPT